MTRRRTLLAAIAATPLAARAQPAAWQPDRPVQLWVAFAPGGAADVLARAIAAHVERARGWTMPVTSRTGGAGVVMAATLRNAPADGHTLGVTVSAAFALPAATMSPPPYAIEDFAFVARLARAELALVVRADGPVGSVEELRAAALRRGQLNVAVQGPEVTLGVLALARHLGIVVEPIPVRGGAEGMTQLLGGHVDAAVLAGVQAPGLREGRLREIVALGGTPTQLTPAVPTLRSLGLDVAVEPWFQVIAPRGVPVAAIAAHAAAIRDALADAEIRALAADRLGLLAQFAGPAATAEATLQDVATLRRLHQAFGR